MQIALQRFAGDRPACPVRLSSLGLFPAPSSVLFAAPVDSAELLTLHRTFHEAAWPAAGNCWAHYLPEQWVPYVTLGEGLTAAGMRAVDITASDKPMTGMIPADPGRIGNSLAASGGRGGGSLPGPDRRDLAARGKGRRPGRRRAFG